MHDPPENHEGTPAEDPLDIVSKALREHPDGITNTVELAERLQEEYGLERTSRQVLNDLRVLERVGEAHSKKLGANAVGWIHDDRLTPPPSRDGGHPQPASSPSSTSPAPSPAPAPIERPESMPDQESDTDESGASMTEQILDAEAVVNALSLPGSGERQEERRQAILACIEWIRETGSGRKSEFIEHIRPRYPAGYQAESSWWGTIGKNGLHPASQRLADIQPPSEGEHVYTIRPQVHQTLQDETDEDDDEDEKVIGFPGDLG